MRIATVILTAVLGLAAQAQAETQDFPYPETHKFWIPGWCGVHWHLRIDQKNLYGGQTFRHYVEKDNWWKMTVYDAHQAKRGEHEGHNLEVHALKTPPLPRDFHFWANPDDENNVVSSRSPPYPHFSPVLLRWMG